MMTLAILQSDEEIIERVLKVKAMLNKGNGTYPCAPNGIGCSW